jgi:hypothetical protein
MKAHAHMLISAAAWAITNRSLNPIGRLRPPLLFESFAFWLSEENMAFIRSVRRTPRISKILPLWTPSLDACLFCAEADLE